MGISILSIRYSKNIGILLQFPRRCINLHLTPTNSNNQVYKSKTSSSNQLVVLSNVIYNLTLDD